MVYVLPLGNVMLAQIDIKVVYSQNGAQYMYYTFQYK